ncbi:hypothetical protein BU23DRAFT_106098 [Bimuria novae-zelandiae CBS 107.79]|uniref:Uncharacterized protein n=1 Tax=Bimuria novae-zelandiae CBS 107.79 TaxID=1447943 RepID=A0A6A5VST8_9PLEO|nr:hypothetical protein BU23DRAFT_106098 [Bimuria novae-zelandiae CBS 107.79]
MAAPSSKTLQSLGCKWKLDKAYSNDLTSILAIQGVGLLICEVASAASIHQTISQPDAQNIEAAQSVTVGKIPGIIEKYVLDWKWRSNEDPSMGMFRVAVGESMRPKQRAWESATANGLKVTAKGSASTLNARQPMASRMRNISGG